MELDLEKLDELLVVLREHGVTEFTCSEFSLHISPGTPRVQPLEDVLEEVKKIAKPDPKIAARGVYGAPSLWSGGAPPSFPGAEK